MVTHVPRVKVSDKNSGAKLLYVKLTNDLLDILIQKQETGDDEHIDIVLSEEKKIALGKSTVNQTKWIQFNPYIYETFFTHFV